MNKIKKVVLSGWFIYLTGIIPAYLLGKYHVVKFKTRLNKEYNTHNDPVWTKGDRVAVALLSLTSWIDVAAIGFVELINSADGDDPAKW